MANIGDVAGDIARQAAAAPRRKPEPPAAQPELAPEPTTAPAATVHPLGNNRFAAIFTGLVFKSASATAKVYKDKEDPDGRASKKLASVVVEIANSGAHLQGSIKAVRSRKGAKAVPEFLFMASQFGGQCVKADSPSAQAELDAYRAYVVDEYMEWTKGAPLAPEAPTSKYALDIDMDE